MRSRAAAALVAGLALVSTASTVAGAHGDDGIFTGTEAVASGGDPLAVSVRARLVYANDSDPAPGADLTVDAVAPDGTAVPPTPLTDNGDGTYEGTLGLSAPGAWTLRFTATTPDAATEVAYNAEAPTTTLPPTTTTRGSAGPNATSNDDDGGSGGFIVAAAIVAVVVLGGGGWLLWRRRA